VTLRLEAPADTAERSARLIARAEDLFPGGVNSPVRAYHAVGSPPLILERGDGSHVWDVDGHRYIDYVGAWGPAILGHAHPAVVAAVTRAVQNGFALGATQPLELELGEAIRARMPSMERMRFVSSGTEAVMSAVRLARAATGRDLIVKFAGGYHGHADAMLVEAGSGVVTHGIPGSAGVPEAVAAQTIVLPYNDIAAAEAAFAAHPREIAAVIVEPVAANVGVIVPAVGFLATLRDVTRREGTVLIFDEVITGFRVARGGGQELFGVRPDLTTAGKIIGGGMPIGAYGGRAELMALVAPDGPVYQAGTLSGHPLSMAAGLATLELLTGDLYSDLERTAGILETGLIEAAESAAPSVAIARVGSLLTVFFRSECPRNGAEALESDREAYGRFFRAMLERGVSLPPSQFEAWFISAAHGDAEIEATLEAARTAFAS
jgi:glutamate-1-semialdehyde 2,1-aminomutase